MKSIWFRAFNQWKPLTVFHVADVRWEFDQCQEGAEVFTCNIFFNSWTCYVAETPDVCLTLLHSVVHLGGWQIWIYLPLSCPLACFCIWPVKIPEKKIRGIEEESDLELKLELIQFWAELDTLDINSTSLLWVSC